MNERIMYDTFRRFLELIELNGYLPLALEPWVRAEYEKWLFRQ